MILHSRFVNTCDMNVTDGTILVSAQQPIICIVAVRCHPDPSRRHGIAYCHNNRRMLILDPIKRQLQYIAGFNLRHGHILPHRSHGDSISCQIIKQVRYSRPRRRFFISIDVIPSENRREIHNTAAGIDTLRRKIGAVPADTFIIVKLWIAGICPSVGIGYRSAPVVRIKCQNDIATFLSISLCRIQWHCAWVKITVFSLYICKVYILYIYCK